MELETLRYVFLKSFESGTQEKTKAEIEILLRIRTATPVSRIKRSLMVEFFSAAIFLLFPVSIIFIYNSISFQLFAFLLIAVISLTIRDIVVLFKKILAYERSVHPVSENLQSLISILQKFSKHYFLSTMILLPVFFFAAFLMVYYQNLTSDARLYSFNQPGEILIYATCFVFWSFCMYFFTKWYVKKSFGNYIDQLTAHLEDLRNG